MWLPTTFIVGSLVIRGVHMFSFCDFSYTSGPHCGRLGNAINQKIHTSWTLPVYCLFSFIDLSVRIFITYSRTLPFTRQKFSHLCSAHFSYIIVKVDGAKGDEQVLSVWSVKDLVQDPIYSEMVLFNQLTIKEQILSLTDCLEPPTAEEETKAMPEQAPANWTYLMMINLSTPSLLDILL